jgi:UDP-N-acetylmuramyl pentapeptide synthase
VSTNVELGDLKKRMKSELSLTSETLQIQYKDEEGDQVTIGTSEELHEAFANAIDQKVKFFKLFIVEVTGSMGSAPQNTRLSVCLVVTCIF